MTWQWKTIDLNSPPKPKNWLIVNTIQFANIIMVYGDPGAGKSMLVADMVMSIVAGQDWLGKETIASKVAWIDADNGEDRTQDRFVALARGHNLTQEQITDNLVYVSYPNPSVVFDKESKDYTATIENVKAICEQGYKVIVVDNLGSVSNGRRENDSDILPVVEAIKQFAKQYEAAIFMIHHTNRQGNYRGFSGILACVDYAVKVESTNDQYVISNPEKSRDAKFKIDARFEYAHYDNGHDLKTARYILSNPSDNKKDDYNAYLLCLLQTVNEYPNITKGELVTHLAKVTKDGESKRVKFVEKHHEYGFLDETTGKSNSKHYTLTLKGTSKLDSILAINETEELLSNV